MKKKVLLEQVSLKAYRKKIDIPIFDSKFRLSVEKLKKKLKTYGNAEKKISKLHFFGKIKKIYINVKDLGNIYIIFSNYTIDFQNSFFVKQMLQLNFYQIKIWILSNDILECWQKRL